MEVIDLLWNQYWSGDLGPGGETRGGSSPPFRTNHLHGIAHLPLFLCAQICAHSLGFLSLSAGGGCSG